MIEFAIYAGIVFAMLFVFSFFAIWMDLGEMNFKNFGTVLTISLVLSLVVVVVSELAYMASSDIQEKYLEQPEPPAIERIYLEE